MDIYKRFWFEFNIESSFNYPPGIGIGCGVTAYDDAIALMDKFVFAKIKRPPFKKTIENVDIRDLDQGHVIPNMKPPIYRGIWFPLGYD